jgi:hypothetical protein
MPISLTRIKKKKMSKVKESPDKNGNGKHGNDNANGHHKAEGHSTAEASSSSSKTEKEKSPAKQHRKTEVTSKLKERKPSSDKLGSFSVKDLESMTPQQRWHLRKRLEALTGSKKSTSKAKATTGNGKRGRPAIGDGMTPQQRWHLKKKQEKVALQKKTGQPAPKRGRPAAPIKSAADLTRQKRWHLKQKLEKLEKMKKKGAISKEVRADIRNIRALLDESYKSAKTVKANKANKRISNKDLASMTPQKRWYHKHKADLAKTRKTGKKTTKVHKVTAKVASGKRISNSDLKTVTTKKVKTTKKPTARLSNKQLKNMSKLDKVLS